jgi:hypothetical protein
LPVLWLKRNVKNLDKVWKKPDTQVNKGKEKGNPARVRGNEMIYYRIGLTAPSPVLCIRGVVYTYK